MMKTRQVIDESDHISAIYTENEIELLYVIGSGVVYDENQIGQRRN